MKTVVPIILGCICLFYACQETIDFAAFEDENAIVLNNPIRFDQLAIGQNSTYIFIHHDSTKKDRFCIPNLDTLKTEIIARDTNGYLVKETTNIDTTSFYFYLDYYTGFEPIEDTLGKEPNIEEQLIRAIITKSFMEGNSKVFKRMGAKFYLNNSTNQLIEAPLNGLCEIFFLPDRINDPLPNTNSVFYQHSELRFTRDYLFEHNNYGNLLLSTHDYGYVVDASAFNYGYSLAHGLVFSSAFRGSYEDGNPQIWHLVPDSQ